MLNWIIKFFLMAVIASVFGFGGMAGDFASIAQFLAGLFIILFVISLIYNLVSGRRMSPPL